MSQFNDGGKGSCQRPADIEKYSNNYNAIFRKNIPEGPLSNHSAEEEVDTGWGDIDGSE